ncbi:DUF4142 domain-containing protein [Ferruginibacter albus]|uniref:DUF4142 domain-containing protein n=1 Tax=Ferruginibacter albus TaxID=2875540 RepID=UPI001CC382C5|nr:DUF4142 domain-containing protein [Ferruginibacter albus]UAY53317.1 DUF4142 domain-containing protein [Ferruginibacter albus]
MHPNKCNILFLAIVLIACVNRRKETDTIKVSDKQNEEKFDSSSLQHNAAFVANAVNSNLFEIRLNDMAQTYASSIAVKQLAKNISNDFNKANEEIQNIAAKENISIPEKMSDEFRNKYGDIQKKTGTDLDSSYIALSLNDHNSIIQQYQYQINNGTDSIVKMWTTRQLPILQKHLVSLQQILSGFQKN